MDENNNQTDGVTEETTAPAAAESTVPANTPEKKSSLGTTVVIAVIALVALAAAYFFFTGQAGPEATNGIDPEEFVASVNGNDIVGADLTTSIGQIAATAQLQGIDTTDPSVQAEIQDQAVDMLINTALLEQAAAERGIVISDEEVDMRIEALIQEIGSEDALFERMATLGIDQDRLETDVKSELVIQALLDEVFSEADISVSEEEVAALYEASTGGAESAPALEEIRPQIEAQIIASKEQVAVDELITELRDGAEIVVAE